MSINVTEHNGNISMVNEKVSGQEYPSDSIKKDIVCDHKQFDRVVGARLRAMRIARGMSQTNLGKSAEVTFQQVQKYENGSNRISPRILATFANVLGVSILYFFENINIDTKNNENDHLSDNGSGFAHHQDSISMLLDSKESVVLLQYFQEIKSKKMKKQIISLIKTMVDGAREEQE